MWRRARGRGSNPVWSSAGMKKVLITTLMPACQSPPAGLSRPRVTRTRETHTAPDLKNLFQAANKSFSTIYIFKKKKALSVWKSFEREARVTAGCQSLTSPHSPAAQISSNVYNKPDHIAQPEPVFLRLAFMTFYPTLEINQGQLKPRCSVFFLYIL